VTDDTHPATDSRALTEDEEDLLCRLAIYVVASQTGGNSLAAAEALDELASNGEVRYETDGVNVWLIAAKSRLVHTTRPWLRAHLQAPLN